MSYNDDASNNTFKLAGGMNNSNPNTQYYGQYTQNNQNPNQYNQGFNQFTQANQSGQYNQTNQMGQYNNQYNQNSQYNPYYNDMYANNGSAVNYSTFSQSNSIANAKSTDIISSKKFNMLYGGMLIYSFLINAIMIMFFFDPIYELTSNGLGFFLIYFAMIIVGNIMIKKSEEIVVNFIGFNLVDVALGFVVTTVVDTFIVYGYSKVIATAFFATAAITFTMILLSNIFQNFFNSIGTTLGIILIITIIVELILAFTGIFYTFTDYLILFIFCGYIGYDWARANTCEKTTRNAIYMACEMYINIVNVFIRLISILSRANRN